MSMSTHTHIYLTRLDPHHRCAWQWLFHVQHDFAGLLSIMGRGLFTQRLLDLFTLNGTSSVPDTTGTIGLYSQGNEPSHHLIFWLFRLGGHEPIAYQRLAQVAAFYTDKPDGLPGNDDAGQLSAWYVCAALGVFPDDPTNASPAAMLRFRPIVTSVRRAGTLMAPMWDKRDAFG